MMARSTARYSAEDTKFLRDYDPSHYAHPSLAVDVVVATVLDGELHVVVVQRREAPQRGAWALPGGFVRLDEGLDEAAARVLEEKAGLHRVYVEQLYTFGEVARDPRTRVVTVTYLALVRAEDLNELDGTLARIEVPWEGERGGAIWAVVDDHEVTLAFDHAEIIGLAVKRLRGKLNYAPVGYELVDPRFTLRDLQAVHEAILGRHLNKDSFRRKIIDRGEAIPTGEMESGVSWRPAELYVFSGN